MKILNEVKLSEFNTFRTGGNARFFCSVETDGELIEVIKFAKEKGLEFFIIGNGSNILISDEN